MGFDLKKTKGPISDINVTPFVDVVLVLLVIFMITAPMLFNGIKLTLPKTQKVHSLSLTSDQVVLSMDHVGDLYIGKEKILSDELLKELQALLSKSENKTLYLRAHYALKYGKVAKLMSFLKKSGISQIALVTQTEKDK